jgi:hypothetical protein
MRKVIHWSLLLYILGAFRLPVAAVVVSNYTVAVSSPTNEVSGTWDFDWSNVYNYKVSSAVAVDSYWLLTAAHVANDGGAGSVVVDGVTYYQQEIIYHTAADDPKHSTQADLALVRFDKPFPGFYPLYTGTFPAGVTTKQGPKVTFEAYPCLMVGYGVTGTAYSTYYTPKAYTDSSKGTKRWGTQVIEGNSTQTYTADTYLGILTNVVGFYMNFDLGDTDYEAGLGSYDSGGGTFVKENGTWKLAGINTIIYYFNSATPSGSYDWMFSVSMPDYGTWVTNVIASATDDDDSDGIPNEWEYAQSGSTVGVDASADTDNDGLTGLEEYQHSTDYDDADTDDDGMSDGWEVLYGLDPLDAADAAQDLDSDTLVNSNEFLLGTDPSDPDMDGDGVLDGWEYYGTSNTTYSSEATSITNSDSDADGLLDGVEMGITNSNGFVTNPNSADTDGDSIPDAWEVEYGLDPVGVSNDEVDSDNDGMTDADEYVADTNPTNAASFFEMSGFVVSTNQTITFNGSTAREYQLFYTTNDLAATNLSWTATQSDLIWGTGTNTSISVTNPADNAFYRLRVTLP